MCGGVGRAGATGLGGSGSGNSGSGSGELRIGGREGVRGGGATVGSGTAVGECGSGIAELTTGGGRNSRVEAGPGGETGSGATGSGGVHIRCRGGDAGGIETVATTGVDPDTGSIRAVGGELGGVTRGDTASGANVGGRDIRGPAGRHAACGAGSGGTNSCMASGSRGAIRSGAADSGGMAEPGGIAEPGGAAGSRGDTPGGAGAGLREVGPGVAGSIGREAGTGRGAGIPDRTTPRTGVPVYSCGSSTSSMTGGISSTSHGVRSGPGHGVTPGAIVS
jgi:hypothetical protein